MFQGLDEYYRKHGFLVKVDTGFLIVLCCILFKVFNNSGRTDVAKSESSSFRLLLPEKFTSLQDIAKIGFPALFKKCKYAAKIPAMSEWSPASLTTMVSTLKDVIKMPTGSFYYINKDKDISCFKQETNKINHRKCRTDAQYKTIEEMKTKDFWDGCKKGKYYWHSSSLRSGNNVYAKKMLSPMKKYILNDQLSSINSWFGCKGVTTELHYDMSHNMFIQIWGRKKITLINTGSIKEMPSFTREDYIHPSSQSILNAYSNNNEINVTLEAGDTLYIPPLVYHRVEVLDQNAISLNIWSKSAEDLAYSKVMYGIPLPFEEEWMSDFNVRVYVTIEYMKLLLKNDLVDNNIDSLKCWYNNRWNHSVPLVFKNNENHGEKKQPSLWAIRVVNNNNYDRNDMEGQFILPALHLEKFKTRSKMIISNITHQIKNTFKQRVILWNYIDQIITFAVTLEGKSHSSRTTDNNIIENSSFDTIVDIISAIFA